MTLEGPIGAGSRGSYRTICRYVAWVPAKDAPTGIPQGLVAFARQEGLHALGFRSYFLACDPAGGAPRDGGAATLACVPNAERGEATPWTRTGDPYDTVSARHQVFTLIRADEGGMTLETDWLGIAACYHAAWEGGLLIASRLIDLLEIDAALTRPFDRLALIELALLRRPLCGRTLHERIRRLETGDVIGYDRASGYSILRRPRLARVAESPCTLEHAIDRTMSILADNLRALKSRGPRKLAVALSGGFDSRLLAAACQASGIPFTAFTYGLDWHHEAKIARRVARALGIRTVPLGYPDTTLIDGMPLYLRVAEGQEDCSILQITNLLRIADEPNRLLLHGFMGDAVAGAHLQWFPEEAYRSTNDLARAIALRAVGQRLDAACRLFGVSVSVDELAEEVRSRLHPDLPPLRAFIMWDLESRQRRLIGVQLRLLGERLETVAPFYDRGYVSFYMSLPDELIHDRRLTRLTLRTRFPRLAAIPHSDEDLPVLPGLRDRLVAWTRVAGRKVLDTYPLSSLAWRLRVMRGPDFWDRTAGTRLRPAMLEGAMGTLKDIENVLGIAIDPRELHAQATLTMFVRSAFALGAYARYAARPS